MIKKRTYIVKSIIAIILAVLAEGYLLYKPFSIYFFGDIASGSGYKLIAAGKLFFRFS